MKQPVLLLGYLLTNLLTPSLLLAQDLKVYEYNLLKDKVVNSVAVDFRNTKWIGTENGLYELKDEKIISVLPPKTTKMAVGVVTIDELGNRWIGTYNSQVFCLKDNQEWLTYDFNNFGNHWISGLDVDMQQTLWVAAHEYGVIRQTSDGQQTAFALGEAIDATKIYTLFADKNNTIWIGTEKGLFALLDGEKKWKRIELKSFVTAIAEYDGTLWVTALTEQGEAELWTFQHMEVWKKILLPDGIKRDRIKEIAFDTQGGCWLAASQIAYWDNKSWTLYNQAKGFVSEAALDVAVDLQGVVWAGTEGKGLFRLQPEKVLVTKHVGQPVLVEPIRKNQQLTLAEVTNIESILNKDIKLNIAFEQSKSVLLPQSAEELDRLVTLMKKNPSVFLEVAGHTDNIGNPMANQKLSEARSLTVKNYLVERGVADGQISTVGYGGQYPIADNKNEKTRPFNRRVEIRFLNKQ